MANAVADIIILSLNRARDTVAAVESALEQEGVAKKIWVLDQGSDAENLALLEEFCQGKDIHLEKLGRNLGVPGGRNYLSELGSAPYIVSLDNDAEFVDRQMVKRAIDWLEGHPDYAAVGFQILNYTTRENDHQSWPYPKPTRPLWNQEFDAIKFRGGAHAIRRADFEAAGRYDGKLFFYWEETDIGYRLVNRGRKIRYLPSVKIYHKVSPELRVTWQGGRYYYMVRNRLYLDYKFGRPLPLIAAIAAAYLVKGVYNGVAGQALAAIGGAYKLGRDFARETGDKSLYRLTPATNAYIYDHDGRLRGSLLQRVKTEVFAKLPSQHARSEQGSGS
jgi:GT2 family glycosyltransferase